jgi:hypothetical protein
MIDRYECEKEVMGAVTSEEQNGSRLHLLEVW